MKFIYHLFFLMTLFTSVVAQAAVEDEYPFDTPTQQAQFMRLSGQLRCLVCQNQSLADSDATLAQDLRQQMYVRVKEGQSDQDILHYFTERYGQFVLYTPPVQENTYLLWGLPLFLFLAAVVIIGRHVVRRKTL